MGKPAATDRPCLPSLSHSFTLDFVVLCNGTRTEASPNKGRHQSLPGPYGVRLSEENESHPYHGRI